MTTCNVSVSSIAFIHFSVNSNNLCMMYFNTHLHILHKLDIHISSKPDLWSSTLWFITSFHASSHSLYYSTAMLAATLNSLSYSAQLDKSSISNVCDCYMAHACTSSSTTFYLPSFFASRWWVKEKSSSSSHLLSTVHKYVRSSAALWRDSSSTDSRSSCCCASGPHHMSACCSCTSSSGEESVLAAACWAKPKKNQNVVISL